MKEIIYIWQWGLLLSTSLVFLILAPFAQTNQTFFKATHNKKAPNTLLLTGSLVISWIFAKSITNAANLGLQFGLVGGVAYALYYLSFAVAGIIIYQLRTKGGFKSIHDFLGIRFGNTAILVFSILILIRLFNEVWSNTMVIGSYFGAVGSSSYYTSIVVFTLLTLTYALKGGLSSSIFTDAIQMLFFSVLLAIILWNIYSTKGINYETVSNSGEWTMALGGNLAIAAFLQSFSYPFHDPVLTDRGFISNPKTTLKSFLWATVIGFLCIVLFSFVGIFGKINGLNGQAAVAFSKTLGVGMLLVVNFIMITSAASTLDSTFSSTAKLFAIDLNINPSVSFGRIIMLLIAIIGTLPVFLNASILSATTISGTMVIGLAPVFILWKLKPPKISYYLSVGTGIIIGFLLVFDAFPSLLIFTSGKYANLLWSNVWGSILCFTLYLIPLWIQKQHT
ncbi:Na+/proline symporter [Tenacibaculum mesophilum]|uniref:Sodium:solute symporter n=1 Tax=Tenacibaculum mesophilum TaxID=104268 RepID=A0ABM7CHA3_9FLAO|nr:sodium:solute symporter [Tenacibaculum mesophilum]GFD71612.1 sodium:solute symporter [Tenacibaculum sp. KUL113]GFE00788.1 sodium:solute symporter [Alteromonas sp. KUL156]AZJ33201.1 sodium:solute symporter [Tenacibaculum mesophilum]QFS28450.1 sodium:solute symporter [Tenacibaculum mesophilum]SHF65440.1 Na+/proline symporter [Tenacibaculum mesophilum]